MFGTSSFVISTAITSNFCRSKIGVSSFSRKRRPVSELNSDFQSAFLSECQIGFSTISRILSISNGNAIGEEGYTEEESVDELRGQHSLLDPAKALEFESEKLSQPRAAMALPQDQPITIIVGAGPSGLSTAACLSQKSLPYIMLEREDCFASLWKKYSYDRLHLHLAKQFCELPLMQFPETYPTYVSRKDFLRYLDEYVSHFKISPLYKRLVESAEYDEGTKTWKLKARNLSTNEVEEYSGKFLVVATGETCDAFVPEVEGLSSFSGEVIHSTRYKNGQKYKDKSVLVVGAGNSGMEIALDLANFGAKTCISIRSPLHILSRGMVYIGPILVKYIPLNIVDKIVVMLSKLRYGDLTKYGIQRPEEGPFTLKVKYGKFPIIDVGTHRKIVSGKIQVLPAIRSLRGNDVVFEDGKSHPFDAIIFATGFKRSTDKWLKGDDYLLNEDGLAKPKFPNHWKGRNGLYCAGLARRGFYGAAMDAQNIANDIKALLH